MANEIGYWNNGSGAQTSALFPDEYKAVVTAANAYTAVSGDSITAVRIGQSTASARVIGVGLYEYDSGTNRPTGPALQTTTITTTGTGTFETTGLSWALTAGLDYVLVAGDPNSVVNLTADTLTDGTSIDDSGDASFPTWGHTAYQALQIELAGDVTSSSSTTITPGVGSVTLSGRAASMNPFTTVTIREVMINEAGAPVTNRTGVHLLVWYAGVPGGAPDLSYSALTTDTNGTASWSLATGGLIYNQTIFYVAHDGGSSLSTYTCARMIPIYA